LTSRAIGFILGDELEKLIGLGKKHQKPIIYAGIQRAERTALKAIGPAKCKALAQLDAWRTLLHDL
jgi:hypothetical protein